MPVEGHAHDLLFLWGELDVGDAFAQLLHVEMRVAAVHDRAERLLKRVGLSDRVEHVPSQMSGGQQQRVAIARSLINEPTLLLADEPTGNLDSRTSVEILEMFQQLNASGITINLVTHDANVASYAHRTIRVVDGLIEEDTGRSHNAGHSDRDSRNAP